jgi:hypothetical protein
MSSPDSHTGTAVREGPPDKQNPPGRAGSGSDAFSLGDGDQTTKSYSSGLEAQVVTLAAQVAAEGTAVPWSTIADELNREASANRLGFKKPGAPR